MSSTQTWPWAQGTQNPIFQHLRADSSTLLAKRRSVRLVARADLDLAASEGLVGAVVVNDHFAGVLVPDLDTERVIASRVKAGVLIYPQRRTKRGSHSLFLEGQDGRAYTSKRGSVVRSVSHGKPSWGGCCYGPVPPILVVTIRFV